MRKLRSAALALGLLGLTAGCYHATIETGAAPSAQVLEKSFASSWVYGLVPPSTVETASRCPNGVARVETQLSFVNQLVGFLTLGIYTPMRIKVTCAEGASASVGSAVPVDPAAVRESFGAAADRAVETGAAVLVRF